MKSNQTRTIDYSSLKLNSPSLEGFYQSCANQYLRAFYGRDFLSCYFLWSQYFNSENPQNEDYIKVLDLALQFNQQIVNDEQLFKERYQKISKVISLRKTDLNQKQVLSEETFGLINELLTDSEKFGDIGLLQYIRDNTDDYELEAFRYEAARRDLYRAINYNDQYSFDNIINKNPNLRNGIDDYGQSLNHILLQGAAPDIAMARTIAKNSLPGYGCFFSINNEHPLISACQTKRYDLLGSVDI